MDETGETQRMESEGPGPSDADTPATQAEMNESFGDSREFMRACFRLEEMRRSGEFCCIDIKSDYAFVWYVTYAWSELFKPGAEHKHRAAGLSHKRLDVAINEFYDRWKAGELE